jgi:hypothetical protein
VKELAITLGYNYLVEAGLRSIHEDLNIKYKTNWAYHHQFKVALQYKSHYGWGELYWQNIWLADLSYLGTK